MSQSSTRSTHSLLTPAVKSVNAKLAQVPRTFDPAQNYLGSSPLADAQAVNAKWRLFGQNYR
jgi:hypothetical protein